MATGPHTARWPGWNLMGRGAEKRPFAGAATQLRPLARRVHFLAGILVAPFVLLLCLTGLVYVVSPQIHEDLYGKQLFVQEVGASPRPVDEQVAAALAAHPEAQLRSVVPPPSPDRTTRVNLAVPNLTRPGEARTVFVDPYTNFISGELTTVDGRMPANVWLRELHSDLHLGAVGRLYSEVAASWLPVLVLGGLLLWIAKQGRRRRSARELLTPLPRGKGEQARMRAVHGPLGLWLTAGLLVMSVTGLTMSRFAGWGLPAVRAPQLAAAQVAVLEGVPPVGVDRVLQVARAEGLDGELQVVAPTAPDRPFTVAEVSPGWPIHKGSIAVDPYTAQVTERIGWGDYPFLARLREIGQQVHMGTLFGVANQIVLALLVIATMVLIVVGYRMWWKRSPYAAGRLAAIPPPALHGLTPSVGVPVVLGTVVLSWLMPAFGISLLAFLVVDVVVDAVRRRQERLRRAVTAGALLVAATVLGLAVAVNTPAPVMRVDAIAAPPGPRFPAPPPPDPPPLADLAVPEVEAAGAAAPPRAAAGIRAGAPAASGGARTTVDAPSGGGSASGGRAIESRGGDAKSADPKAAGPKTPDPKSPDSREADPNESGGPGRAGGATATPAPPADPVDDAAEPEPPREQNPPDDSPGLVGGLVGTLVDTVQSVTGRLLGG
jgi:uncharacterized iron-regulated membrane protein